MPPLGKLDASGSCWTSSLPEKRSMTSLLGGAVGQGLEPVGVVGHAERLGPALHAVGNEVGHFAADGSAFVDGVGDGLVGLAGQVLLHLLVVEDVAAVVIGQAAGGRSHFKRLAVGKLLQGKKTHFGHNGSLFYRFSGAKVGILNEIPPKNRGCFLKFQPFSQPKLPSLPSPSSVPVPPPVPLPVPSSTVMPPEVPSGRMKISVAPP